MDFKIRTSNYLGLDHETFKDNLQSYAITKPSKYFEMRAKIIKAVKKQNLENFYNLFYNLLTEGKTADGRAPILATAERAEGEADVDVEMVNLFKPSMPSQQVSEIALGAVKTLDNLINKIMDDILPREFLNIASNTAKRATMGALHLDKE